MKKLTRRIAVTGISCMVAGGVLFATGGSATAACPQPAEHTPARTTMADTGHRFPQQRTAHRPTDPWIADQIALFGPTAATRPTAPDPWIADQLALFTPAARQGAGLPASHKRRPGASQGGSGAVCADRR